MASQVVADCEDDDMEREALDAAEDSLLPVCTATLPTHGQTRLQVYDMIRDITDPEHPLSLEQLKVACPLLVWHRWKKDSVFYR